MSGKVAAELISKVEKWKGILGGIADIADVLNGPSYSADIGAPWRYEQGEQTATWLPGAASLLVLIMHHPQEEPELDWFDRGNTAGNRRLMDISNELVKWLRDTHGIAAQALPYQVEKGGVYLKDAACLAGLGVIGKNNLLIHPEWGAHVRLRSVLIQDHLPSNAPLKRFNPCGRCSMPCLRACPEDALAHESYHRKSCIRQLESDRAHERESGQEDSDGCPLLVTAWCRECEFACPVGKGYPTRPAHPR